MGNSEFSTHAAEIVVYNIPAPVQAFLSIVAIWAVWKFVQYSDEGIEGCGWVGHEDPGSLPGVSEAGATRHFRKEFQMKHLNYLLAVVAVTMMSWGVASAATITISSISGTWDNVQGGQNLTGEGTSSIRWGGTTGNKSGYDFVAETTPFSPAASPFDVGTFTHLNFPIPAGTSITGAELTVGLTGDVDGNAFSISGTYGFTHTETPNATPCFPGSVSVCDDIVSLTSIVDVGDTIEVDGEEYYFVLSGFDGSLNFFTEEGKSNSATLQGGFTTNPIINVDPVPLPAGMVLLGTGIAAFGVWSRKGKRKA